MKRRWLFHLTGMTVNFWMRWLWNRHAFTNRNHLEPINFRLKGVKMGKAKHFLKKLGFVSYGCGYPHSAQQLWYYWRLWRQQLHIRLRKGRKGTLLSVHFEPEWTQPTHTPNSIHPPIQDYYTGLWLFYRVMKTVLGEVPGFVEEPRGWIRRALMCYKFRWGIIETIKRFKRD